MCRSHTVRPQCGTRSKAMSVCVDDGGAHALVGCPHPYQPPWKSATQPPAMGGQLLGPLSIMHCSLVEHVSVGPLKHAARPAALGKRPSAWPRFVRRPDKVRCHSRPNAALAAYLTNAAMVPRDNNPASNRRNGLASGIQIGNAAGAKRFLDPDIRYHTGMDRAIRDDPQAWEANRGPTTSAPLEA